MPVPAISPHTSLESGAQGGELVRQLHGSRWGSLRTLNRPVAPTVLKISPLSREVSINPVPLGGGLSDIGHLRCPCPPPNPELVMAGSP